MFPKPTELLKLEAEERIKRVTLEAQHIATTPSYRHRLGYKLHALAEWLAPELADEHPNLKSSPEQV